MRKFEFEKTYEELEINGNVYKVDFSDTKIKEYQKKFEAFYANTVTMAAELENADESDKLKSEELFDKTSEIVKEVIDILLGEGSYDKLYEESNKSIFNMLNLLNFLGEIVAEKATVIKEDKLDKYLGKKQKRR